MITIIDKEKDSLFGIYNTHLETWLLDTDGIIIASNVYELLEAQVDANTSPMTVERLEVKLIFECENDKERLEDNYVA